ncbi:LacI family transcriptional regulator [Paenibacillus sp. FSL H7-0357]|uniref:LacI family DNA-binding transcriptional regulator n=1 Tax=unclassified Paenibacillus TaxID=185978 RepID=UPI0004F7AA6D|nr:LacI family DNA-binding transcriptional regulator [Paenibacillus sp. FSL H7-0357]AIQ18405.1 LacI family transcriptional regulator [Paenibacillus sp. FSL H7-0357]
MASIKEVADIAGVAVGTVSRVINNHPSVKQETREKVLAAIKEINYVPNEVARNFKMQKSMMIALLLPTIRHPFFSELAYYIEDELDRHDYKLILCNSKGKPEKELYYFDILNQNKVAGIIAITYNDIEHSVVKDIPLVSIDRHFKDEISCVTSDNYNGGRIALQELHKAGVRHPAYLGYIATSIRGEVDLRKVGFMDAAKELGLPQADYEIPDLDEDLLNPHLDQILTAAQYKEVDGVFVNGDMLAARYIKRAREHGIQVPEDVKVVGYDGIQKDDLFHPFLSTIVQPVEEMARTAVRLLIQKVEGVELHKDLYRLPVTFRQGGTT